MKENSKEKEQSEYVEDETTVYEVDLECLKAAARRRSRKENKEKRCRKDATPLFLRKKN